MQGEQYTNNTPASPQQTGNAMPEQPNSGGSDRAPIGPIIAAIVVVAILAIGGLYYWGSKSNERAQENTGTSTEETTAPTPEELRQVSEEDDLDTIEGELQFDTENLDAEMQSAEAELQF